MVPNGWSGDFPNALSHVMVQDYIAKYGGTAALINADVAEAYGAGQVEAAAVQATAPVQAAALRATGSLNQQAIINWLHKPTTVAQEVNRPGQFHGAGRTPLLT